MTLALTARRFVPVLAICAALAACGDPLHTPSSNGSLLIADVQIVDGSGSPPVVGSVRVRDGLIVEIGELSQNDGEDLFHGRGLALAPGFIDTHSHADADIFSQPEALAAISQGITTVVVGQDGRSPYPLADFVSRLGENGSTVNFAAYVGHNTLRGEVMGTDFARTAKAPEIETMTALLRAEMAAGAMGLATGLEYEPGMHSGTDEVLALAQAAADLGGRYISHIRSEDRAVNAAIDEAINIGRVTGMPVQISHIKLAMKSLWGSAPEVLQKLDAARDAGVTITADVYPYEYWQSTMMVLLPERDATDRDAVDFALAELAPPDGIWMTRFDPEPDYVGMKLSEIASLRETDASSAFMQLAQEAQAMAQTTGERTEAIIGTSMSSDDLRSLLAWEHSNICTDGGLIDLHPRATGSFTRVLGRYVREENLLSLAEAVRKMSGLSADHMGFGDRGYIRIGQAADLVLFDPDTVIDRATPEEPTLLSEGIAAVWVGGELVFANQQATAARPGQFLAP